MLNGPVKLSVPTGGLLLGRKIKKEVWIDMRREDNVRQATRKGAIWYERRTSSTSSYISHH